MKLFGSVFLIVHVFLFSNTGLVFSQDSVVPRIENPNSDTIRYCSDSILVVPDISIQNIEINEASEGMKISIANYKRGEDILVYDEVPGFVYKWVDYYGYLEIKGVGTAEEYQSAVSQVFYKNLANIPTLEDRSFSISLLDADYLPQTKHFYRYIKKRGILWTEARDSAANMDYYGLKGYLATITSRGENDFIWSKIDGVGWIGANDSTTEGTWKWVTGPESGTQFWQGDYNGGSVGGQYSFWNTGEPNNVQKSWGADEDYAHINSNPNTIQKSWNDLSNEGDRDNPNGYYYPEGFIVEFGGFSDEPDLKLSATAIIKVAKIAFSDQRNLTICQGESVRLNNFAEPVSEDYNYSWLPAQNINFPAIASPLATPPETTVYTVTGTLGECVASADFNVNVNPAPIHTWDPEYIICEGESIELDPGEHSSYLWETLDTTQKITVDIENWYTVTLTNEFACTSKDSTFVKWSILPVLDYGGLETLVCGSKQQKLNLAFENGTASTNLFSLSENANIVDPKSLSPTITVDEYGIYNFQMEITDQFQCEFLDTLKIEFHNQPTVLFQIDEAECEGYNLKLYYEGTTYEDAVFNWYSNDTLFLSGINIDSMEIPLGYGAFNRSVGLIINEQGCIDSLRLSVTVTPILDFWAENPEGCTPLETEFDYSASEQVDSFYWEFGDGFFSIENKPTHIYENPGINDLGFDVQLKIVSAKGCENTGILNNAVIVHPIPIVNLSFEENICYNETETVWYNGSGNEKDTFYWDLTDFLPDEILQNPGISPGPLEFKRSSDPIVEIGIEVVSEFGCETGYFSRTFQRKPLFEVSLDKNEGCPPVEVEFGLVTLDEVDNVNYNWDFGDESTGSGANVSNVYFEDDKKFDVEIIAKSLLTGCSDTIFLPEEIFVFPVPKQVLQQIQLRF